MTKVDDVRMFWGTGSGSASKSLRHMNEDDVMISYTTTQKPWSEIDNLFVDSGGYSLMLKTGEHGPVKDYFDYIKETGANITALQDYPCEPEILSEYDRTVRQHQELTLERAAENLAHIQDRGLDVEPVAVLQGWEVEDYIRCIDRYRDEGVMTDYVGIGSVCRRGAIEEITEIIKTIGEELPEKKLHAFGVKQSILKDAEVRRHLTSVDSSAWYQRMYKNKPQQEPAWHTTTKLYLDYKRKLYEQCNTESQPRRDDQSSMKSFL